MSLKIRRGTNVERLTITPAEGELIYTTDTKNLYIGDGTTAGGKFITGVGYSGSAGSTGYTGSAGNSGAGNTGYTGSVGYIGSILNSDLNMSTYSITNGSNLTINGDSGELITNALITNKFATSDETDAIGFGFYTHLNHDFSLNFYDGTRINPTPVTTGSSIGNIIIAGYTGSIYKTACALNSSWDDSADLTTEYPSATLRIFTGNNSSSPVIASLDNNGVFTAPILQPGVYATTTDRDAAITAPSAGMIIFLTTGAKFQGYDGTSWVDLN